MKILVTGSAGTVGRPLFVHLAAQPQERPFPELVGPNVIGLYNVIDAARDESVRRLLLASSMMVVSGRKALTPPASVEQRLPNSHYALT